MQRSAFCRSRRELSNEYLLANVGFDTAENEPFKVRQLDSWVRPNIGAEWLSPPPRGTARVISRTPALTAPLNFHTVHTRHFSISTILAVSTSTYRRKKRKTRWNITSPQSCRRTILFRKYRASASLVHIQIETGFELSATYCYLRVFLSLPPAARDVFWFCISTDERIPEFATHILTDPMDM